ncbi:MAG: hemerythrin domain-containing protein [Deltaproteobacteria bacterium]|nr:hemerythrin domain-containing protein [Deltaproteobacteria bacterium]
MSNLIQELQKDHILIVDILNAVRRQGIMSREGKEGLNSVKDTLLAHLTKEDTKLYPVLRKASETDAVLKQTLDIFTRDMDEVSKAAMRFFDKYASGGQGTEFARDFGWLYATLQSRIRKEENTLYKAYERLNP